MDRPSALRTGLIGYLYRWLRNGGVAAVVSGIGLIGFNVSHEMADGHADATVQYFEVRCVLRGKQLIYRAISIAVDCADVEATKAKYTHVTFGVSEHTYARLVYQSEIGASYQARVSLDAIGRPDVQRGDTIPVIYSRANPNKIRMAATVSSYVKSAWLLASGLIMLLLVWLVRRAANYQGDVAAEVAALEASSRTWSASIRPQIAGTQLRRFRARV